MKFTVNWLKQYIDPEMKPQDVADRLTMAGLEVDSVDDLFANLGGDVRVGRIRSVIPHPNADRLTVCEVEAGEDNYTVVCGAPNAKEGLVTAIALPGAALPTGLTIKEAKIRGQASFGMLCSEKDLGISEDHSGIMELPDDLTIGQALSEALSLEDTLIEVDLTPNRSDCTSVIGIAREVGGFSGKKIKTPVSGDLPPLTGEGQPFSVEVLDWDSCPRYTGKLIKNVKIGPSPWWLKRLLLAVGLRPINNIVDITNFVMLEYGQPLHAFDFARLKDSKIVVRTAKPGEKIITLDGMERILEEDMLLICDAEKPVAVAGIMGGEGSQVEEDTKDILLESAYFNPISIRRTVRKLNMGTDSSYRFERGVDPHGVPLALERAARLMAEWAGGEIVSGGVDACQGIPGSQVLTLREHRVRDLLGIEIGIDKIAELLAGIEIEVEKIDDSTLQVTPPSFRVDIEREVDLVEEVARLVGYNEIPSTMPVAPMSFPESDANRKLRKKVAHLMSSLGFYEAINYSFASNKHREMLGLDTGFETVNLLNPLTEDQSVMRTEMLPGILENLRRNINHQTTDVRLFETGKVYHPHGDVLPVEEERLVAVMSGHRHPTAPIYHYSTAQTDFYDAKGVVEALLSGLRLSQVTLDYYSDAFPFAEPEYTVALKAEDRVIGSFGKLKKEVLKGFGIKQETFYIDLNLDEINRLHAQDKTFCELPKYPFINWDIAVLVPENVGAGALLAAVDEINEPLVEKAEIFDVYQGDSIEKGFKSVAISITYRSQEKTLEDELVSDVHNKITDIILSRFKGKMREV